MALWRFIKVLLAALIIFAIVVFFLSNSTPEAQSLSTPISFKFNLAPFFKLESVDFPVGYLIIIAFTLGMIMAAIMGALNAFSRSREIKMKNKTIRELEKEIDGLRDSLTRERNIFPEAKTHDENYLPERPEVQ